ncbi:piggyBac transposable element-derived protein 4-like, partial [Ostrinia furnacalis]|uniref:piggyBac transposable element-derived protein 4-like n=1 Tax=Ostrinia furnacalis TaxID=93504 RepID=UPI00103960B8
MIYVSPSTSKTHHMLQNVTFSPPCSSQLFKKNKSSSIPCSPSLDFPHLEQESRASSLSEISRSNLLDCDISLNEDKINELLRTPQQKRENQNYTSEYAQSEDSNAKSERNNSNFEVSVTIENIPENIETKNQIQNRYNKQPVIYKSCHIIDEDKIERICCDENKNRTSSKKIPSVTSLDSIDKDGINSYKKVIEDNRSFSNTAPSISNSTGSTDFDSIESLYDSNSDKDYDPSNVETTDSESDISLKDYAGIELELASKNMNLDVENQTLDIGETPSGCQTNKQDEDEWEDISESPVSFDEFVEQNTLNIPPFAKFPEDIYKLFVTDDMIYEMVSQTNNYARNYLQTNQSNIKRKSRMKQWSDTSFQEMKTFMAVLMAMGLNKVPQINLYWSKNKFYRNEFISSAMTRDRFLALLKFWHVSDISNDDKTDKLHKIRYMFSKITENFQQILKPGKKDQKKEVDHSQNVVLRLMKNLTGEGRIVIVDNYYTSLNLAEKLLAQKTFICGTLNIRRKHLPKTVILSKIKKGEIKGKMNKNGVKVLKWVDKRQVLMLTTCKNHDDKLIDTGKKKRGSNETVKKPGCVLTYNNTKKGIDFSDQMSSYYTTLKKGLKWWRKVIMELLFGTALVNAWIVYNLINDGNKMSKLLFVEAIIKALTKKDLDT